MAKKIDTISDEKWADLQRRTKKAAPRRFTPKAIRRQIASADQRTRAIYS
jgi:hypothetical protein